MKKLLLLSSLIWLGVAGAATDWLGSDKAVLNYLEAIGKVQAIKNVPISVPKLLPGKQTYYMTVKKRHHNQYIIFFDSSKNCNGVKVCNVGNILATKFRNPEIYYSRDNKPLTEKVMLKNGTQAYFTPAHPMGDYWPARIEWRAGPWLLQLTWKTGTDDDQKQVLIKLASQISSKS